MKKRANKYSVIRPCTLGHLKGYDYVHGMESVVGKRRVRGTWFAGSKYNKDWPEISKRVREEREYRCGECEAYRPGKQQLFIHHLDENKRNDDLANLVVLCTRCHFKVHHYG